MIEFDCWLFYYDMLIRRIFCCDCFFDQIHFLIREKDKNFVEISENKIRKNKDDFLLYFISGTLVISCSYVLKFIRENKDLQLFKDLCVTDFIWCEDEKIALCSACAIDIFRKTDILHCFKLKE